MDRITNTPLWVSDIGTVAQSSLPAQIDTVVSVCQDETFDNISDDCRQAHFRLAADRRSAERWGGEWQYEMFERAADFVHEAVSNDECVLVHCHKGRNRSVAVCAAVMGSMQGIDFETALTIIRAVRPIAGPNGVMQGHAERYIEERGEL
jgi:protein-tyrosine phosphatase